MKKKEKGLQPSSGLPPPPWLQSKMQCLLGGEEVEGEEVGTGSASSLRRGEGRGSWEKKKKKLRIVTMPL